MGIHPSYNILFGRPWIHTARAVASSLHQCLKYIMNGILITIKAEERVSMIKKNTVVPFIEVENCRYRNINAFEIVNVEWVPGGVVLKKLKISEVTRMVANYFLKNRIPF